MILSDKTIKENLESGRILIDPLGENAVQPSSVDLRIHSQFRVFKNHSMGIIDVKENLEDLTELVEITDGEAFILHPENLFSEAHWNALSFQKISSLDLKEKVV